MNLSDPISGEKSSLRDEARRARANVPQEQRSAAAETIAADPLSFLTLNENATIGGYNPSRDEIDCLPLMRALEEQGHTLALPVIEKAGEPLFFRQWRHGTPLVPGTFKIPVPPEQNPICEPDVFLVPLLAFDKAGYRLGYGGGFYDRTLAKARHHRKIVAIGLAFACQEVSSVPIDQYDQKLDWMLTPDGPIELRSDEKG